MIKKYLIVKKNPWDLGCSQDFIISPGLYIFRSKLHYRIWYLLMRYIRGYGILDKYKGHPLDGSPLNVAKAYERWNEI